MSNIAEKTTFKIRNTKLQIPIVTLFTNDSVKLTKQLNDEFKRSISWNEYKTKTGSRNLDDNNLARFCLDDSFHGVKRFFFFAFGSTNTDVNKVERNSHRKYSIPRVNITTYNMFPDGRNVYDQPNNDQIKKYDEIRKIAARQGDVYLTGCLLDYQYFKDQLIAVDSSN